MQYENHRFENEMLPFIFHYNIISRSEVKEFTAFGNWHENPEILYFTKGSGVLFYNKRNYEVSAGDLAIVNPDCFHAISSDDRLEYYCLIVDCGFFRNNGIPIDRMTFVPIVQGFCGGEEFYGIEKLYRNQSLLNHAMIRAKVLNLIISLADHYRMTDGHHEDFPESIKNAVTYIKTHYNEEITIEDIVRHVGFSRAYFSREFKKNTGVTLIAYLNHIRCRHATALLAMGSTVGEAAERCGFGNLSYFSKTYRRLMGVLPSEAAARYRSGTERENKHFYIFKNSQEFSLKL